jgi:hypothetical protein
MGGLLNAVCHSEEHSLRDEESRAGTFATTVVTMRFLVGKALLGMTRVLSGDAAPRKSARRATIHGLRSSGFTPALPPRVPHELAA